MKQKVLAMLLLVVGLMTATAQNNTLTIPPVTAAYGKAISLPVNLDNTADVVAVQFTVTVPAGLTLDPGAASLTERAEGLSVTMREKGGGKYMAMIYSPSNTVIRGRTGTLMTVPLNVVSDLEDGSAHQLALTDVVIAVADGSDVTTGIDAGTVTIAKSADLAVSDVTPASGEAMPGGTLSVSWRVSNVGGLSTSSGWSEQVFLRSHDGTDKVLVTTYNEDTLGADGVVGRSAEFRLPDILGMDGAATVGVRLVPNSDSGEPTWLRDNNTALSASGVNVGKRLTLTPDTVYAAETSAPVLRLRLNRSGSTSAAETFQVTSTEDGRLSVPATVVVPKGRSGEYLYIGIEPNGRLDDISAVEVSVSGNGYGAAVATVNIEDDTLPGLTLTADKDEVTEGQTVKFTIEAQRAPEEDVEVILSCDHAGRFRIPSATLQAGQTKAEVIAEAKDDDVPDVTNFVAFVASADGYASSAEEIVDLLDNDVPSLQLDLTPGAVSEADGPLAVVATLRRTDKKDRLITVRFSDDSDGGVYYSHTTVEMKPGVEEVVLNIGAVDNAVVEGERTVNVSASVWVASCSCSAGSATSGGTVTVPLTIYDNDGPTLSLSSSSSVLKENGEIEMTVGRNTEASSALSVNISTDHDSDLEYDPVVVIPEGATSAKFTVKSIGNDTTGDSFTAVMTAEGEGHAKASAWFMVSDQTLPDARIAELTVSDEEIYAGEYVTVTAVVKNDGSYELPELTKIGFYERNGNYSLGFGYLQAPLAAGESVAVAKTVALPDAVGAYRIYAVANDGHEVQELTYTNNRSAEVEVSTVSPFSFALTADKAVYMPGENIVMTGKAAGKGAAGKAIDVYVVNEGSRRVLSAETDENGGFSVSFQPYDGQYGHFTAGACYPGEKSVEELASFDVRGMKRTDTSYLKCEAYVGEDYDGTYTIRNYGPLPATGLSVSVVSKPDGCAVQASCPSEIAPGETGTVSFKITPESKSTGSEWEHIVLSVSTEDGITSGATLYYYCYIPQCNLEASVANIDATVTKGTARTFPLTLKNTGKGETGRISISMPSWMSTLTPGEMASLQSGEETQVVMQLSATDDMPLNVARTGSIMFNCENGSGLSMPFTVVPVSDETGTLTVDVCDNYTYYTAEAPHVANASVVVKDPSMGRVVASGVSDENGVFSVTLSEGYYSLEVTAESHQSYSNNVYVNPGRDEKIIVNLPIETIKIDWNVVETEIEDEYLIETTVKYETNVPAPVVKIGMPKGIDGDEMVCGESVLINVTLTNVGLITARNTTLVLPEGLEEWGFEALAHIDPFDLAPQQSVIVPVRITRNCPDHEVTTCTTTIRTLYEYLCGNDLVKDWTYNGFYLKTCVTPPSYGSVGGGGGYIGGGPGSPGGFGGGSGSYTDYNPTPVRSESICEPCDHARAEVIMEALRGRIWLGAFKDAVAGLIDEYRMALGNPDADTRIRLTQAVRKAGLHISESLDEIIRDGGRDGLGALIEFAESVRRVVHACDDVNGSTHGWNLTFDGAAVLWMDQIWALEDFLLKTYGDRIWYRDMDAQKYAFLGYAQRLAEGYTPSDEELTAVRPESVTLEQMKAYISHLNGSGANFPTMESVREGLDTFDELDEVAAEKGYEDMNGYFADVFDGYERHFREMSDGESVCSSISLSFKQRMTMTRQAFRGTLKVYNGNDAAAMTDVRLNLDVRDNLGHQVTSRQMQMNAESLDGFEGEVALGAGWTLAAGETGVAEILFIPTKYAAPETPCEYSFGGTLTYIDPYTGLEVTRSLYPVTLTVKPSPNLDLTYFMQRDVLGDDPLTEAIEPSEEAEFSLLINNIGFGDATDVRMETSQPEIVANDKGLDIKFNLLSSILNGKEKTLAIGGGAVTDFGTIPAKSQAYAQWMFNCNLLGHFTDYDVKATHVRSYNNPDLSLLNEVTIHELIRSIDVPDGDAMLKGFMTNDVMDVNDTPDMLYLSNGETADVYSGGESRITKVSSSEYSLTVTPETAGWNYGNISDPTYGVVKLKKVVRQSDGSEISLRNFWQTDRTLRDGKDPLYENRIHFVDDFKDAAAQTYLLSFEPAPDIVLEVVSIEGVPAEGTLAYAPIDSVNVKFNKQIDASTFTADDITFRVQGNRLDTGLIGISTEDNKTFKLDLSELNKTATNGYHVLAVQAAGITDLGGFQGRNGKSVGWNMYAGGLVLITTSVNPLNAGRITGERNVMYGDTAILAATPNEGYMFSGWTVDGKEAPGDSILSRVALGDMKVVANFRKNTFRVNVDSDIKGGGIIGSGSGLYEYGEQLKFEPAADEDYEFASWVINGTKTEDESNLTFVVKDAAEISAEFKYVGLYHLGMDLKEGWNWISHHFSPSMGLDAFSANEKIVHVKGHTKEAVRDPELGMVGNLGELVPHESYKALATARTSMRLSDYTVWDRTSPIAVNPGWNWLGYPVMEAMALEDAFAATDKEELDMVVGQEGFAQYDGQKWVGTLGTLSPGLGYMYQSRSAKNVAYGTSAAPAPARRNVSAARRNSRYAVDVHKYPSIMPVVAVLVGSDGRKLDADGYQVAAFSGSECRGIGSPVDGLLMMSVHGNVNDPISFRVTDAAGEVEYPCNVSVAFREDMMGDVRRPYEISINEESGVGEIAGEGGVTVYVDGDRLRISGVAADDVELVEIYDIDGHKLMRETSVSEAGVKVSPLTDGVYVVIVKGEGEYSYHKIVIR